MRVLSAIALGASLALPAAAADGDPNRGQQLYRRACVACHSLKPDMNMTGPSLAGVWKRKAGSLASFSRYSPALKESRIIWDEGSLDRWLTNPAAMVPKNRMTFPGLENAGWRQDLIALLKQRSGPGKAAEAEEGMAGAADPTLRQLTPNQRVTGISHCRDTYKVTTSDGQTMDYWERNLRFKTDSSESGPIKGAPAIVGAGMAGDRASVIFSAPEEISGWIKQGC
jgi:cytochrome c